MIDEEIKEFIKGKYKYSVIKSLEAKGRNKEKDIYIYNEISLQHELGIYLRKDHIIKFEVNLNKKNQINSRKTECDILILNSKGDAEYAIELKYLPKDCGVPRRMFQCVEDMVFMKDVAQALDIKTYCIVITEDKNYYVGQANKNKNVIEMHLKNAKDDQKKILKEIKNNFEKYPSIYEYFREGNEEKWKNGKYIYSQLKNEEPVVCIEDFKGQIEKIDWKPLMGDSKYYILSFERR